MWSTPITALRRPAFEAPGVAWNGWPPVQSIAPPPNSTVPAFNIRLCRAIRFSCIGSITGRNGELGTRGLTYCSEVLMEVNLVLSLVPSPFTTAMMASEIPAASKPYSMAVAPDSSARNARSVFMQAIKG